MARRGEAAEARSVVFDTDVLVWYFRGSEKALRFVARVPARTRAMSSLTVMELLQGCRNQAEARQVKDFVVENVPLVIHPDEPISRRAIDLIERHAMVHGLRVVDAIIAATALEIGAVLATANVKHYRPIATLRLRAFQP